MKIIYIGGYGRSGSTILDIVLGNHTKILSLGEVCSMPLTDEDEVVCSCGECLSSCSFYKNIFQNIKMKTGFSRNEMIKICRKIENIGTIWRHIKKQYKLKYMKKYRTVNHAFFEELLKASSAEYFIDSSKNANKTAYRPIALKYICGFKIKFIHLVRDGRAVIWSMYKGSNRQIEAGYRERKRQYRLTPLRAICGWFTANFCAWICGKMIGRQNYHLIRYEDLVENPEKELIRIGVFLDIDTKEITEKVKKDNKFSVGHQIAGNRVRRQGTIRINGDFEWKDNLPVISHMIFWLLAWPMAVFYNYKIWEQRGSR